MKEKILIVEDNPANMRLLEMALKDRNYTLLKATDGEEALLTAEVESPDLILMDVRLPRMNGLEVVKRLRQSSVSKHIPIIGITAYAMKGDRERVVEAGCDVYLPKPINTRELPGLIEGLLQRGRSIAGPAGVKENENEEDISHR